MQLNNNNLYQKAYSFALDIIKEYKYLVSIKK